ncbi:MAG: efflux RND transporter periplasmic adaptor subunit [Dichotomicrobium sp.]
MTVAAALADEAGYDVRSATITDRKSVFATVQSTDRVSARARLSGTIVDLRVDEGSEVTTGEVIAIVGDEKLGLEMRSVQARIQGLEAELEKAKADLDRGQRLSERGVISESRMEELRTQFSVTRNNLESARGELSVLEERLSEGEVLAPAPGRVLDVPVTAGSVVMPGESIATVAANKYILRLEIPERHARYMSEGDAVSVGARGLSPDQGPVRTGKIVKVYPELGSGRVVADAEVAGLGDFFVGERVLVWVAVNERETFLVPPDYVFQRYSQDYVRLVRDGAAPIDVVVQPGQTITREDGTRHVEILSGLQDGDRLVKP